MALKTQGLLLVALPLLFSLATCEQTSSLDRTLTVVLVRHGEYDDPRGDNPGLDTAGLERAQQLAHVLSPIALDAVYATQFRRTQQTARPTASSQDLDVQVRDADQYEALVEEIGNDPGLDRVLIVAHGDSVPAMIEILGARPDPPIEFARFDDLFIVEMSLPPSQRVRHLKYGRPVKPRTPN